MSQVKLVFTSNANPMLWLVVEDLLYHLKSQEMKASVLAAVTWKMKRICMESSSSICPSSRVKTMPRPTSHGHSRLTRSSAFRIHNYSGAKKVAMASLEFEDYANTWWEQVVTLREEKGDPPIDTWEDMKEEMQARFVPTHYKTDLFNKLQNLKQGTKTVEEFFKEMELTMMRANIQDDKGNVKIQHTVTVNFKIGPYEDTVECDVVPMTVCHMLLGRPWQFDKNIHDGFSNAYTFKVKDKKFELRPMTPSQIIADNAKALARAQHHIHH
ncbi:hypothetical protein QYE76_033337 [Lolium multiflorum]|uniref:Retrotransposon gag domain-containing protein n=1 Tax=Lolium multiflorum TaxID=4521 RepID=A0AAD8VK80_LOLMU|nr:hypothetical protein QYE76_033337 [Lolium multiflorum]